MIGRIVTADGRAAELGDDGVWSSNYESLAAFLNSVASPLKQVRDEAVSRAMPWWGRPEVEWAADRYGTEPEFPTYSPAKTDLVF